MKRFSIVSIFLFSIALLFTLPTLAAASITPSLLPTAAGTYSEWSPNTGTTHYTLVDEGVCNGLTDYVATSTTGKRDSYGISLSTIPDNSVITDIAITPCASRAVTGTGSSVLNVFYRYGGTNSSDLGSYAPSGTTPSALATSTWSGLSLTKTSGSTLEIGMVYTSGTKGGRLSRIAVQLTYGQLPAATTSAASSVTSTSAVLNGAGNPNGTSTTAWFRIATSTPGTCNDTFGTRVPLSGSTSLGTGTSSVAYATTTSSLTSNTTYYYCAIASNGYGKGYGAVQSFTSLSGPIASTTINSSITTDQHWTTASGTIVIDGAVAISSPAVVTVDPGVVVKFKTSASSLTVSGTLDVQGTTPSPVYFTSFSDDAAGGDLNADGSATTPAAGNWGLIEVPNGGRATFAGTVMRYGGANLGGTCAYSMVCNSGGVLSFDHSEVATSTNYGIYHPTTTSGTTTVTNSDVHNHIYGFLLYGGTTTVATTTVRNQTQNGIYFNYGSLSFNGNTFSGNTAGGVYIYPNQGAIYSHSANTTSGAGKGGIIIEGYINHNQTWQADTLPYIVTDLTVLSGSTLTIDPGAVVKFNDTASQLMVSGGLIASSSSPTSKIYFTSIKDDAVGGDSDGLGGSPEAGDWNVIKVASGASSTMKNVVVRYGGYAGFGGSSKLLWNNGGFLRVRNSEVATGTQYGIFTDGTTGETVITEGNIHHFYGTLSNNAVEVDGGILDISGSNISNATSGVTVMGGTAKVDSSNVFSNSSYGVYQAGGVSTVQVSTVYYNNYGIYLDDSGTNMYVHSNYIYGNTTDGVYNNKTGYKLQAQYNYWGASNGPGDAGSGGGDGIDWSFFSLGANYDPWLTSMHYVNVTAGGATTSAVHSRTIKYVATSTQYTSEWYKAVDTWNALGAVTISTSTSASTSDLWVFDINDSSQSWVAGYSNDHTGSSTLNDQIRFNSYYMPTATSKLMVATHELGHALGLGHSYQGNVMFCCDNPLYATTTLGIRDISDYNWLWP